MDLLTLDQFWIMLTNFVLENLKKNLNIIKSTIFYSFWQMVQLWTFNKQLMQSLQHLGYHYQSSLSELETLISLPWKNWMLIRSHYILNYLGRTKQETLSNSCNLTSSETITFFLLEKFLRRFQNKWLLISNRSISDQIHQVKRSELLKLLRLNFNWQTDSLWTKEWFLQTNLQNRVGILIRLMLSLMDQVFLNTILIPLQDRLLILNIQIHWNSDELKIVL